MRPPSVATLSYLRASIPLDASTRPAQRALPCALCLTHTSSRTSTRRNHNSSSKSSSPSTPSTHYHFFPESLPSGPPPKGRFAVDLSSLKKEFLQLQARAHPD